MASAKEMSKGVRRLATGVLGFDDLVAGGLPKGSMTVVLGNPGVGKSILGRQFLYTGLIRNESCLLISTDPFERFKEAASDFGWETEKFDRLIFLDCFSHKAGIDSISSKAIDLSALTNVSIAIGDNINDIRPNVNTRLVLDSLSEFILQFDPDSVAKFLSSLKTRLNAKGLTSLIMLEEGVHDQKTNSTIEFITDGTVKMKADETGRYITISRMQVTPTKIKWIPFEILKGIELKAMNFFS